MIVVTSCLILTAQRGTENGECYLTPSPTAVIDSGLSPSPSSAEMVGQKRNVLLLQSLLLLATFAIIGGMHA